ncbi:hypothetical protein [Cohnella cellulosilytica]|uniref:Alpha/beta hydrolase family protein n=1 Tax=Cohnella cellulosilytica TaxID=986710 RepID=A0ABW2FBA5_9BACL
MRKTTSGRGENNLEIYCLAGLATAPRFMENLRLALMERLGRTDVFEGAGIRSSLLYPYGDWSRNAIAQMREIRADMSRKDGGFEKSIGGGRALEAIGRERRESGDSGEAGTTLLVGHSGGGIAAVHAAAVLTAGGASASCFAVKIGSPRCRIPERLKSRVLSIHAEGRKRSGGEGRSPDFVSRIGSYGGWGRSRAWPVWRSALHAPGTRIAVPIVGKHADYFRDKAPYLNEDGKSNLELVVEAIAAWLTAWK